MSAAPRWITLLLCMMPLCLSGCLTIPRASLLLDVPFYPQEVDDDCGAAALKCVLAYREIAFDESLLSARLHLPALKGTIPALILKEAQTALPHSELIHPSAAKLQSILRHGVPPILFLAPHEADNPGHFVVLTGLNAKQKRARLHSGSSPNRWVHYDAFIDRWERGGRITIVLNQ
jgi:ABC-type bacteriocin/lantibiotic exporter with double-glycine peptidase domain